MKLSQWRGCTYLGLSSLWRPIWQMKIFSNSWNNLKSSFLLSPEFSTLFTIPRYTHTLRWMNLCALLLIIALILFTARWVDLLHAWMCRCVFIGRENTLSINIEFTIEALWALLACVKVCVGEPLGYFGVSTNHRYAYLKNNAIPLPVILRIASECSSYCCPR